MITTMIIYHTVNSYNLQYYLYISAFQQKVWNADRSRKMTFKCKTQKDFLITSKERASHQQDVVKCGIDKLSIWSTMTKDTLARAFGACVFLLATFFLVSHSNGKKRPYSSINSSENPLHDSANNLEALAHSQQGIVKSKPSKLRPRPSSHNFPTDASPVSKQALCFISPLSRTKEIVGEFAASGKKIREDGAWRKSRLYVHIFYPSVTEWMQDLDGWSSLETKLQKCKSRPPDDSQLKRWFCRHRQEVLSETLEDENAPMSLMEYEMTPSGKELSIIYMHSVNEC